MAAPFIIGPRFQGPPGTAHGGTVAACLAGFLPEAMAGVTVRLRRPVPVGRELAVQAVDGRVAIVDDGEPLAIARTAPLDARVPPAPSLVAARAAGAASSWHDAATHPFPHCFGCGPLAPADALHGRLGPLGDGRHAATWTPPADVSAGLVLAALDCPSSAPVADVTDQDGPWVLGTLHGRVDRLPTPGQEHVLSAWPVARDGRKLHTGCALHAPDGAVLAVVHATWVAVPG